MSIKTYVFVGDEKEIEVAIDKDRNLYPIDLTFSAPLSWYTAVMLSKECAITLRDKINTCLEAYDGRTSK